LLGLIKYS